MGDPAVDAYIEQRLGDLCKSLGWPRREWLRLSPAGRRRLNREALQALTAALRQIETAYANALRTIAKALLPGGDS